MLQCKSKSDGMKEMHTLAVSRFFLPGEAQFPLNAMYSRPANKQDEGLLLHSDENSSTQLFTSSDSSVTVMNTKRR